MSSNQLSLQDSNSLIMENMIMFYDNAMLVIMLIVMSIMYMITFMYLNKFIDRYMFEGQLIEMIWTIIPMIFLNFIAFPSLSLLYLTDEIINPEFTVKSIGHQWYWSYKYNDFNNISFDSFMMDKFNQFDDSMFRLLDVDNRLILPYKSYLRILSTSSDVIHSFTVPSLSFKVDALPGRMNQINLMMIRPGIYYGQCFEICGVNHSFMPIVIESVNMKLFNNLLLMNNSINILILKNWFFKSSMVQ